MAAPARSLPAVDRIWLGCCRRMLGAELLAPPQSMSHHIRTTPVNDVLGQGPMRQEERWVLGGMSTGEQDSQVHALHPAHLRT